MEKQNKQRETKTIGNDNIGIVRNMAGGAVEENKRGHRKPHQQRHSNYRETCKQQWNFMIKRQRQQQQ